MLFRLMLDPTFPPSQHTDAMLLAELSLTDIPFLQVLLWTSVVTGAFILLNLLFVASTKQRNRNKGRRWFSRLLYIAYLAIIAVLAVTSFGAMMRFGHMHGYALLIHVGAAGAFVFLMLAIAFLYLPTGAETTDLNYTGDDGWWLARWSAWALILSSLGAAGTMFLSMLPILDTGGLLEVAALHRFFGLAVVVCACVHAYTLTCTRLGLR